MKKIAALVLALVLSMVLALVLSMVLALVSVIAMVEVNSTFGEVIALVNVISMLVFAGMAVNELAFERECAHDRRVAKRVAAERAEENARLQLRADFYAELCAAEAEEAKAQEVLSQFIVRPAAEEEEEEIDYIDYNDVIDFDYIKEKYYSMGEELIANANNDSFMPPISWYREMDAYERVFYMLRLRYVAAENNHEYKCEHNDEEEDCELPF